MRPKRNAKKKAKPPRGGLLVVTESSPMTHAPLPTLDNAVVAAGWDDQSYSLLSLTDWSSILTYESDLDAMVEDICELASRQKIDRLLLAISDSELGPKVAARLREHPSLATDNWLEIRFQLLPRTSSRMPTAMIVIDGDLHLTTRFALPLLMRETFSAGRYAVLATARGVQDLTVDGKASERLLYQMNRALGCQVWNDQPVMPVNHRRADMIVLIADERQERSLRQAAWLTRQMFENVPVHIAMVRPTENGGFSLRKLF